MALALKLLSWLKSAVRSLATNIALRELLMAGLIVGLAVLAMKQCRGRRTALKNLRVSEGLVTRLQDDSTALKTTITHATSIRKTDYIKQAKQLQADSLHADTLSVTQLEFENDSLLAKNRQYVRDRAAKRNQPAASGL